MGWSLALGVFLCLLLPVVIWHSLLLLTRHPVDTSHANITAPPNPHTTTVRRLSNPTPIETFSQSTAFDEREEEEVCLDAPDDVMRVSHKATMVAAKDDAMSGEAKHRTSQNNACRRCVQPRCAPNKIRGHCRRCH
jgi:hypothetical protein